MLLNTSIPVGVKNMNYNTLWASMRFHYSCECRGGGGEYLRGRWRIQQNWLNMEWRFQWVLWRDRQGKTDRRKLRVEKWRKDRLPFWTVTRKTRTEPGGCGPDGRCIRTQVVRVHHCPAVVMWDGGSVGWGGRSLSLSGQQLVGEDVTLGKQNLLNCHPNFRSPVSFFLFLIGK